LPTRHHSVCWHEKTAKDAIQEEAFRCNMHYVNQRWLGGTLTILPPFNKHQTPETLEEMKETGEFSLLTKKEACS
jgi:small subunit ribosomal protein S2